jgi:hypothetical protein
VTLLRVEPERGPRCAFVFVDAPAGRVAELRAHYSRDTEARALLLAHRRLLRLLRLAQSRPSGTAMLYELGATWGRDGSSATTRAAGREARAARVVSGAPEG